METIYLGLGSNIGNRQDHIMKAVVRLSERVGVVSALSSLYETEPWGFASENTFLNAVVCMQTFLSPGQLLEVTQQIERELGRTAKSDGAYHDRIIDIDLLMYDAVCLVTPSLVLPHPLMHERLFVMEPLAEIAPDVKHPVLFRTFRELSESLKK